MPEYLSISQIMQSAVTPVFLLAGIGALLSVMTGRLGRITDRLRYLQIFICKVDSDDKEILLSNRKRLISRAKFINTSMFQSISSVDIYIRDILIYNSKQPFLAITCLVKDQSKQKNHK